MGLYFFVITFYFGQSTTPRTKHERAICAIGFYLFFRCEICWSLRGGNGRGESMGTTYLYTTQSIIRELIFERHTHIQNYLARNNVTDARTRSHYTGGWDGGNPGMRDGRLHIYPFSPSLLFSSSFLRPYSASDIRYAGQAHRRRATIPAAVDSSSARKKIHSREI